jgi:hypothetical protein
MRKIALAIVLLSVIAVAGCTEVPGIKQAFGEGEILVTTNPDLSISANVNPTEIKGGRPVKISFEIQNKQPYVSLEDVNINVYDQCIFTGDDEKIYTELDPNQTKGWNWDWNSNEVEFERDCTIGFRTEWGSTYIMSQDTVVLSEAEYYNREQAGTLDNIQLFSSKTDNPLIIDISFLDPQPYLDEDDITMFINYRHDGDGFLDKLETGEVSFDLPDNFKQKCYGNRDFWEDHPDVFEFPEGWTFDDVDENCNAISTSETCKKQSDCYWYEPRCGTEDNPTYIYEDGKMILDKDLKFVNDRAPQTTCTFEVTGKDPINMGTLTLTANYKYQLDNSLLVKITPR